MDNIRIDTELRFIRNVPVLDVVGEIDIYTTPQFKEELTAVIDRGFPSIVVNMRKVSYMDSSGFSALLSATKRLRPINGSLHLCCCNDGIRRMLQITRLDSIFGVYANEDDAVAMAASTFDADVQVDDAVATPIAA